jgi:BirA family biotin operon repressor/biotin-[acetyl-CoA-carboxylase] ligase
VDDKKIAGILIETAIMGDRFSHAIAGIGLNVNQELFVSDAPNPVSMKMLTGDEYDLTQVLQELCIALDTRYLRLIHGEFASIQAEYGNLLYKNGIWAKYHAHGEDFEGKIMRVEPDGRLLIETKTGEVSGFYFKEVAYR